ncbi:MAG: hypothetical protein KatS3mg105_4952 [Gemmatales bacterium]|nr:MAG: hypothetical protein KatS3mg105_4952 [Gemmatales bacterium]
MTDDHRRPEIPELPWTEDDLNRLVEITEDSSHLEKLCTQLAEFGEGGIALINPAAICQRPTNPYCVGRCLQDAYADAGGTECTSEAVYRQSIKRQFGMLPRIFEAVQEFLLTVSNDIRTQYPDWTILDAEEAYWKDRNEEACYYFPGPFGWAVVGLLRKKFAMEHPEVLMTET